MIYLLYGNDFVKSRAKLREIIASQMKKNPDASYFKLNSENWSEEKLGEFIESKGLFQNAYIVVCDELVSHKQINEAFISHLKEMKESSNIFIVIEESLTKEHVKKIEKHAEKVQEFTDVKKEKPKGKDFNVFVLTDALGARDKKRLWLLYQDAIFSGVEPEQIHGLFFWQAKAMLAAQNSSGSLDSGLNPFVYKKALGFSKNFTPTELQSLSSNLVTLYHEARRGAVEFDIALERFVLGV
jgi:DNA polymerase III delta subunit